MRTRTIPLLLALALVSLAMPAPAPAEPVVVKLATLVPEGTIWHQMYKEMEADWSSATQGRVTMRLYAGGVAGDDPDMVRKMRIGQLQGAMLTAVGLSEIDPSFKALRLPMFFSSYEELRGVLAALKPELAKRLEAKGFVLLDWTEAGWVNLFSRKPIVTIADLKAAKLFSWAGDEQMTSWWKEQGFEPVSIATTDVPTALQTGMIEAIPTTPLAALTLQWYRQVPNMLQLGFGPLVGATVMTKKTWDQISPEDRAKVLDAAVRLEQKVRSEIPKQDKAAVDEMVKRGLKIVPLDAAAEARWRTEAEKLDATMRGVVVPAEAFDMVFQARDAWRKANPGDKR